ncbi:MAG: DUF2975 domain-containing protein [Clostridiales bacterium]|nr:DUF2975 domain-containing protein [Candidatus Coliplasma caballi]
MKNKTLITLSQISIAFLFFVGICICLFWYPLSISFSTLRFVSGESSSSVLVDQIQTIAFWSQLIFAWIASVPCFVALVLGFRATIYAKGDEFFSKKNAKIFKIISVMLFIDSVLFIIGNIVFMFLKWNPFALIYYVIGALGIIFALASCFTYRYLEKAASLKEENDSIL